MRFAQFRSWRSKLVRFLSRRLSFRNLDSLESLAQLGLGKGWDGGIDGEIGALLTLRKSLSMKSIVALDIGANTGLWTCTLKQKDIDCEVHVFEPSASAFELLEQSLKDLANVHLYRSAVGESTGTATLYSDFETSPLASLSLRRLDHQEVDFTRHEEVAITTLDDWHFLHMDVEPNVLKIDVEGHEIDVLHGASKMLDTVQIVQFEFGGTDIDSRIYFQDFWYFFLKKGFDIFRLTPKGLQRVVKYSENDEVFKFTTFFAVRSGASLSL